MWWGWSFEQEGLIRTTAGEVLTTPVVMFQGRQAARVLEGARGEGLLTEMAAGQGVSASGFATMLRQGGVQVLDQIGAGRGEQVDTREAQQGVAEERGRGLLGSPAELEMAAVLRRFAFTSEALRSCVIVAFQHIAGTFAYVKGAPEVVQPLCRPDSVPRDIAMQVAYHTRNGRRVLACAYRACGAVGARWAAEADRSEVERELEWAGLLVMENTLKSDSTGAI